jgi:nucleoside transporter
MSSMSMNVRIRLSVMMFLQYMMFAVWFVPLAAYLDTIGVAGTLKALILSSMPIGCLVSPIFCMIADRHFASQKVLMVLNLCCAGLLFLAALQGNPTVLFILLLLAMFCYMPTWSVANAVAMSNAPSEEFPRIRVFGSIGWVAAAVFSLVALKLFHGAKIDGTAIPLYCGAGTAVVAALLNLTLPNTPPPAKGMKASIVDALGLRALGLLKDFNLAMFIGTSLLVMIPFTLYFSFGSQFFKSQGYETITARMSLGQVSEMLIMPLVPLALARWGVKWTMIAGAGALLVRYLAFWGGGALALPSLYYLAILVHGAIFGLFFVGGQVYIDKKAPPELRAQAQGLISLMCFGAWMLIGTFVSNRLIEMYTIQETVAGAVQAVTNWNAVWVINVVISAVALVAFGVLFRDDVTEKAVAPAAVAQALTES